MSDQDKMLKVLSFLSYMIENIMGQKTKVSKPDLIDDKEDPNKHHQDSIEEIQNNQTNDGKDIISISESNKVSEYEAPVKSNTEPEKKTDSRSVYLDFIKSHGLTTEKKEKETIQINTFDNDQQIEMINEAKQALEVILGIREKF